MSDGSKTYMHQVYNKSGYILLYPNVATESALLEGVPPNPYAESATQLFPLGTKLVQGERIWRYCKNGAAALAIGVPIQSMPAVNAVADDDMAVGVAADIGDYVVSITSQAAMNLYPFATEEDGLAEGYLIVNDGAGQGQCYKIKSSEAFSGTSQTLVTLYDPLTIALATATSQVGIHQNPYANVIVTAGTALSGICVGIPQFVVTTAYYYFWSQTGGPAAAMAGAAIAKGTSCVVGTTAAVVSPESSETAEVHIGYPLTPAVTVLEHFMIFLTIDR